MKYSFLYILISCFVACSAKSSTIEHIDPMVKNRIVNVSNSNELKAALGGAQPGDSIILKDNNYTGKFVIDISGTVEKPIVLIGSRNAVLDAGDFNTGYVLELKANYWHLRGFKVTNGLKGIMADEANHNLIDGVLVTGIGEEGIHLRSFSCENTIQNTEIKNTGLKRAGYGEGIYIGSANNNWEDYSNGKPDKCDNNKILNNKIGPGITAECIDIKEGTTGGLIYGNEFNAEGISGENSADSWMDIKGNNYVIENNKGTNTSASQFTDGYQVNCAYEGWGNNNIFKKNQSVVNAAGYAINVRLKSSKGTVSGTIVYADNTAENAAKGVSNITLTPSN